MELEQVIGTERHGIVMDKRFKLAVIGGAAGLLILLILLGSILVDKLTPSKEMMQLTDYYQVGDSEVLILLQDKIYEKKGVLIDKSVYIDYDTVVEKFNHRFYWDGNEKILTYTTPDEIIQSVAGSKNYSVTKSMIKTEVEADIPIVEVVKDQVYLSLDFV
jgi:hypothetical protein